MRPALSLVALLVLAACGGSYPGGARGADDGGSGGVGGTGGSGGAREEPLYEVAIPGGIDVAVRSQLFAVEYLDDGILPSRYTVYLLDEGRACAEPSGLRLDDGESWISIAIGNPTPGECPVFHPSFSWTDEPLPPSGCYVEVDAGREGFAVSDARGGSLRIDRLDADLLAGELRVLLPSRPIRAGGCWGAWGDDFHGGCECHGPDGVFECETTDPVESDCCDDTLDLVEVSFPFAATRCKATDRCGFQPCTPLLATACESGAPPPPVDCEAACDAYATTCASCLGCPGTTCEELGRCDRAECLDRCRELAAADPLVSLSLACLAEAPTCGEWASCVSACGEP